MTLKQRLIRYEDRKAPLLPRTLRVQPAEGALARQDRNGNPLATTATNRTDWHGPVHHGEHEPQLLTIDTEDSAWRAWSAA